MSWWRAVGRIAWNAIHRQLLRPTDLVGMVVAPFVLALVFGYVDANRVNSLPVGLVVEGQSVAAARVEAAVGDEEAIRIRRFESQGAAVDAVERGELDGVLVVTGTEPNGSYQWLATTDRERSEAALAFVEAAIFRACSPAARPQPDAVEVETLTITRDAHSTGFNQSAPGLLTFFAISNGVATGILLLDDRRHGLLARLRATPHGRAAIVTGVLAGRYLFFVLQLAILVGGSALLFDVSWGDPAGVAAVCALLAFVGTTFAVVLATLPRADFAMANNGGLGVSVLTGVLGGCFWPLWIVPDWLRTLSRATPQSWAIDAFERLGARGAGLGGVAMSVGVLALFGAVLGSIAWNQLGRTLTEG